MGRRGTEGADVACALARFAWRRLISRGPSHELSADRDVMLAAVRCDARFLTYAAKVLRADREIILAAVQQDASFLKYGATALRADRAFILAAVQQDASFLKYASAELRADREVVLAAVKKGRNAIQFAAPELLKAELELVLAAVHQDTTHLKYAPLRADVYAILAAIRWAALTGHIRLCSEIGKVLKAWDPPAGKGPFSVEVMTSLEEEWKAQCTGKDLWPGCLPCDVDREVALQAKWGDRPAAILRGAYAWI